MAEEIMPAAEAAVDATSDESEQRSYEFAFHVLPTVAEGEVAGVVSKLKALITKEGGEIFDEESPERVDLAYDIVKAMEGKNRKFHSAYFGWLRFRLEGAKLAELTENVDLTPEVLRYLLVKISKYEEENPFRYHVAMKESQKKVRVIEEKPVLTEAAAEDVTVEVSEVALDESIEKMTDDTDVVVEAEGEKKE